MVFWLLPAPPPPLSKLHRELRKRVNLLTGKWGSGRCQIIRRQESLVLQKSSFIQYSLIAVQKNYGWNCYKHFNEKVYLPDSCTYFLRVNRVYINDGYKCVAHTTDVRQNVNNSGHAVAMFVNDYCHLNNRGMAS